MSYIEENLNRDEEIVMKASLGGKVGIIIEWSIFGFFFIFSLIVSFIKGNNEAMDFMLIGAKTALWTFVVMFLFICAVETAVFYQKSLAFTNKRVLGRIGAFVSTEMDAPLEKIQTVILTRGWFGNDTIKISTAAENYIFTKVKNAEVFKKALMEAIAKAEEEQLRKQAEQLAAAVQAK